MSTNEGRFIQTVLIFIVMLIIKTDASELAESKEIGSKQEMSHFLNVINANDREARLYQADLNEAMVNLAAMGDTVIEPVTVILKRGSSSTFQRMSVLLMKEIATPKAQSLLLDIAMNRLPFERKISPRWVASSYLEIAKDKLIASKNLLSSQDPEVLFEALSAMKGFALDEDVLKRVYSFCESQNTELRGQAISVIGADPNEENAEKKLDVLLHSYETAGLINDADMKFHNPMAIGTISDGVRFSVIRALNQAKWNNQVFIEKTNRLDGIKKQCVIIVRAYRGDASVKSNIYEILNDPNSGMLKTSAIMAFKNIGDHEDIPFLRQIVSSDSLNVEVPQRHSSPPPWVPDPFRDAIKNNRFYPVRFLAQVAISYIERANDVNTIPY